MGMKRIQEAELTTSQKRMVTRAKSSKEYATKLKRTIAEMFKLPYYKFINIEKSFKYINYLKSDAGRLDKFLFGMEVGETDKGENSNE